MPVIISTDIVPPIKILAKMDALSNNHLIPPDKPFPIIPPSGPIAIKVRGTMISNVTVGTIIILSEACVIRSIALST
ncbi:hypothetical protein D3C74_396730 [compost metagenome]